MQKTNHHHTAIVLSLCGALTLTGMSSVPSIAIGDEAVVSGEQAVASQEVAAQGLKSQAEETQATVATLEELNAALANTNINTIILSENITCGEPVVIDALGRSVIIDLNGQWISFSSGKTGGLTVTGGTVSLRNGHIFTHIATADSFAVRQTGGALTLDEGLYINAFAGQAVSIEGGEATIAGASIEHDSPTLPAIVVDGTGSLAVRAGEVDPAGILKSGTNFKIGDKAKVVITGGTFGDEKDTFEGYVAEGYGVDETHYGDRPSFSVKGDLSGKLASITVNPTSYVYDGYSKRPEVTVMFDGEDVTDRMLVSYENNREVGTATVKAEPRYGSDAFMGEATTAFTIAAPTSTDPGSTQPTNQPGENTTTTTTSSTTTPSPSVTTSSTSATVPDLSEATVNVLFEDLYTYDGTEKKPLVTVKIGDATVLSSAYTLSYANNVHAGTATVTITAKEDGASAAGEEAPLAAADEEGTSTDAAGATTAANGNSTTTTTGSNDDAAGNTSTNTSTTTGVDVDADRTVTTTTTTSANAFASPSTTPVSSGSGTARLGYITKVTGSTSATFQIERKRAWVAANSATKWAGEADPTFTALVTGTLGSDTLQYTLTREPGETAGTYKITAAGDAEQGDYEVTYSPGYLLIYPRATSSGTSGTSGTTGGTTPTATTSSSSASRGVTPATADTSLPGAVASAVSGTLLLAVARRRR